MRMYQIKIFHIFVPNLSLCSQNSFFSESKAYLGPRQLKKTILGLKTVFIWFIFGIERVLEKQHISPKLSFFFIILSS